MTGNVVSLTVPTQQIRNINFKNRQKIQNSSAQSFHASQPITMDEYIARQQDEQKKAKRKQSLSWALGIAVSIAFITYFGKMGYDELAKTIKNSAKNFKKEFVSLADKKGIVSADSKSIDSGFRSFINDLKISQIETPEEMYKFLGEQSTPNMILLTGGSGVGKSYNADVACKELGWKRLRRQFSDISSKYIGETSKEVQKLFESIEKVLKKNPNEDFCLVLDEADSLFVPLEKLGGEGQEYLTQMRSALLNGLDSVRKYKNFHMIATTNARLESGMLDKAIVRRIGNNYELPYPTTEALLESLKTHMQDFPYIKHGDFDFFKNKESEITTFLNGMQKRRAGHGDIETLAKNVNTKYRRFITEEAIKQGAIKQNGNKYEIIDNAILQKIYSGNPISVEYLTEALKTQGTLAGEIELAAERDTASIIEAFINNGRK